VTILLGRSDAHAAAGALQAAGAQQPIRPSSERQGGLHICSILTSLTSGGAEMLVVNLSGAFVEAGTRSTVIALCDAATLGNSPDMEALLKQQIESQGGCFISLGLDQKRGVLTGGMALRRVLRQAEPGIVHAHTARALGMIALAGARVTTVLTHHNSKLSFPPGMFALFDRIASGYVAISEETAGISRRNARRPYRLIPNAAAPKFRSEGPRTGISRPAHILSAGAVSEQKNYGLLIEVARHLRDGDYPFEMPIFQIAGHGPSIEELRGRVKEYGIGDAVHFLGERADIESLMTQSDIYLNTSVYEGMPIALLEAMAMALPIVATDVAGNRELVRDAESGFLCELGSPAVIAESLARLICDEELYRQMSRASLAQSDQYSLSGTAGQHIDLYETLIANRGQ
jgi:glycosyltransferase involved in cell wall biosynthesis